MIKINKNKQYNADKILEEHGIHYDLGDISKVDIEFENLGLKNNIDEIKKIIIKRREQRQRYLLERLVERGAKQLHIEEVFDIALKEIDRQEAIKHSMETKAGIMLAFYGVIVGILFQSEEVNEFIKEILGKNIVSVYRLILIGIGLGWAVFSVFVIVFSVEVLLCKKYGTFLLDDEVLKAAVADKNISMVTLLETAFEVANRNCTLNNKKGKMINWLLYSIIGFVIVTFIFLIITMCYSLKIGI